MTYPMPLLSMPVPLSNALRRLARMALAFALGAFLALGLLYDAAALRGQLQSPGSNDFGSLYLSAWRVAHGDTPYWPYDQVVPEQHPCHWRHAVQIELASLPADATPMALSWLCRPPNLNPPVLSVLMVPLTWLTPAGAYVAWSCLSVFSVVWAVALLLRAWPATCGWSQARSLAWVAAGALGVLAWFPAVASFTFGQVTLPLCGPLVWAWASLRQGHAVRAGACLGLLMGLKLFMGLFLFSLLCVRQWRAAGAAMLVACATLAVGAMAGGWPAYEAYFDGLARVNWLAANWNGSVQGYVSRFLGGSQNVPLVDAPGWARGVSAVICLGLLVWLGHRLASLPRCLPAVRSAGPRLADAVFVLTVPAMLLLSPLGWLYYFPFLVLPGALVWLHGGPQARQLRSVLLLVVSLSAIPRDYAMPNFVNEPWTWVLDWGFYTYALLLMVGCGASVVRGLVVEEAHAA